MEHTTSINKALPKTTHTLTLGAGEWAIAEFILLNECKGYQQQGMTVLVNDPTEQFKFWCELHSLDLKSAVLREND